MTTRGVTRLAPSPSGSLHLGNARTFLVNWAMARRRGWRVLLRIEDLNTPKLVPGAAADTVDVLRWLGLDWDEGPVLQSADLELYAHAMHHLAELGLAYPCELTRREIEAAAAAPNEGDHETRCPPDIRPAVMPSRFADAGTNWRLVVDPGEVRFVDRFLGERRLDPADTVGDFVVWTKRGEPSYQLAVVVDDARQGVTEVVRGDDLLDSVGRQARLYRALDVGPRPAYTHLPLVRGPDGRRLAKRHGDTRLSTYKNSGVPGERIVAMLARWSGVEAGDSLSAAAFAERFELNTLPPGDVTFTEADDRWLRSE